MTTKTRRKRHSEFYRLRVKLKLNEAQAGELAGVPVRTIRRWDQTGAPQLAMRLFFLWDRHAIQEPGWDSWVFSRGALLNARAKLRFRPETLTNYPAVLRERSALERELDRWQRSWWFRAYRHTETLKRSCSKGFRARVAGRSP